MSLPKSTLSSLVSHAQMQLLYEKYRQTVVLKELDAEAPKIAALFKPTAEDLDKVRELCPHSFLLRVYNQTNK